VIRDIAARLGLLIAIKRPYYAIYNRLHIGRTAAFYAELCGPGDLVFDVGANLGQKAYVFLKLGARVVSVEPERECVRYLRSHFSSPRLTVVQAAVSDSPGRVRLFLDPQTPEIASLDERWLSDGPDHAKAFQVTAQDVEAVTLSQLVERYGVPDYLKIDVEGHETRVLQGLHVPVKRVSFEFHTVKLDELARRCALLGSLGAYEFNYTLGNTYRMGLARWVSSAHLADALRDVRGRPSELQAGDVFARLPEPTTGPRPLP
jgi:FkbM family methyltransferase